MSATDNTSEITSHPARGQRGRTWLPIALALMGGVFVAIVIVAIVRGPEAPEPADSGYVPANKLDDGTPVVEAGGDREVPSPAGMFEEIIDNSGIDRIAEEEAAVRATPLANNLRTAQTGTFGRSVRHEFSDQQTPILERQHGRNTGAGANDASLLD